MQLHAQILTINYEKSQMEGMVGLAGLEPATKPL